MPNDVYTTVRDCSESAQNMPSRKRRRPARPSTARDQLQFAARKILGPAPKRLGGSWFELVMMNRYTKLTRGVPMSKTTAWHIVSSVLDNWFIPCGIPEFILTDIGIQSISKYLLSMRAFLCTKNITTMAYHPQTNGAG